MNRQHQDSEKVVKWATVIKIKAVIAICIARRSYVEIHKRLNQIK